MAVALITGFPGFIATRLVRRLLADDAALRVIALVEDRMAARGRQVADGLGADRIEVLCGDITRPGLGLGEEDVERLAAEITSVFHLAAIYDLAVPLDVAERVNVEGTGNVLELCGRCDQLERLHYVSTAYVAGARTGVVYEHELVMGQGFKNFYESTKFQAEVWIRRRMAEIPTTIYRPAIVVGESTTGETQKFDGPYYVLRSIAAMGNRPIPQIGRADAPFNVVPVDFVIDALAAGARDPTAVGATLHLVDPEPVTASQVTNIFAELYAGRRTAYRLSPRLLQESLRFGPVRKAVGGSPRESIVYLNHSVRFDTRQASALLARYDVACPKFAAYAPAIVEFFRAHEHDPALNPQAA
jgi:thioester reductase-like protein